MPDSSTNHEFAHDVFLSHSSKDKRVVLVLAEQLREATLRVWYDDWEIKDADHIPSKIEEGLKNSRVLVLCVSENAPNSDWATLESQFFRSSDPLNKQRRFIAVRLDDTIPPGTLSQFKYIDWYGNHRAEGHKRLLNFCRPIQYPAPDSQIASSDSESSEVNVPSMPKYNARIAKVRTEIQKHVTQISVEVLVKVADAFELEFDEGESQVVMRTRLFDHIVNGQYKLTRALNRTRSVHNECEPNDKRRIKELLIRVCPLRFNTANIYNQIRTEKRGKVGDFQNAEVLMAGVDGTHVRLKQDILHPGFKSTSLPEIGFSLDDPSTQGNDIELKTFLADLYSELCERLSASHISDMGVTELADKLRSMTSALSEQAYDRTVYCVLSLPKDEIHREHSLALINRAAKLLQEIVWIEYHPGHSSSERDFSNAFAWILNLDD